MSCRTSTRALPRETNNPGGAASPRDARSTASRRRLFESGTGLAGADGESGLVPNRGACCNLPAICRFGIASADAAPGRAAAPVLGPPSSPMPPNRRTSATTTSSATRRGVRPCGSMFSQPRQRIEANLRRFVIRSQASRCATMDREMKPAAQIEKRGTDLPVRPSHSLPIRRVTDACGGGRRAPSPHRAQTRRAPTWSTRTRHGWRSRQPAALLYSEGE